MEDIKIWYVCILFVQYQRRILHYKYQPSTLAPIQGKMPKCIQPHLTKAMRGILMASSPKYEDMQGMQ